MGPWDHNFIKCDKYKIAGFCFPKTGSSSLRHIINSLDTSSKWDSNVVTKVPEGYRSFFFIRNPYDRIFSWYKNFYSAYFKSFDDYIMHISPRPDLRQGPVQPDVLRLPDNTEIYRFEEFETSIKQIMNSIGLTNYQVPHKNPTKGRLKDIDYKDAYTNSAKLAIRLMHRWEIKNFNYTFDSYGKLPTIKELKNKMPMLYRLNYTISVKI